MPTLCVFCGSSRGIDPVHAETARTLGHGLAERGWSLVFGGGHIGLMGVVADAVLEKGGEVVGVIPRHLVERELAHTASTHLHVVESMHDRKALMAQLAEAFVALPGGYGTLEELFEILTWKQLGLHDKPIGLLNVGGFFDPLLAWIDRAVAEGFIKEKYRGLLQVDSNVASLLDRLGPGN